VPDPEQPNPSAASSTVRAAAALTSVVVAGASVTLSYLGLLDFASGAGIEPPYTLLFPLTVIGMVAIGFLEALQAALSGARGWFGRALVVLGVAALAAGGVNGAPEATEPASLVAYVLPPVALLLTLEALLHIVRRYGPVRAVRPRWSLRRPGGAPADRIAGAPPKAGAPSKGAERREAKDAKEARNPGRGGLGRGRRPAEDETGAPQPVGSRG
jgi:hypothetical protein